MQTVPEVLARRIRRRTSLDNSLLSTMSGQRSMMEILVVLEVETSEKDESDLESVTDDDETNLKTMVAEVVTKHNKRKAEKEIKKTEAMEVVTKQLKADAKSYTLPKVNAELMDQAWQLRARVVLAWHGKDKEGLIKILMTMERLPVSRLLLIETGLGFLLMEKFLWSELPDDWRVKKVGAILKLWKSKMKKDNIFEKCVEPKKLWRSMTEGEMRTCIDNLEGWFSS